MFTLYTLPAGPIRGFRAVCFFQAEDGIRDLVRSRGLGDVYKRQAQGGSLDIIKACFNSDGRGAIVNSSRGVMHAYAPVSYTHLTLPTSDLV